VRQHLGKLGAALAVLGEFKLWPEDRRVRPDEGVPLAADDFGGDRLTFDLGQFGLIVEQVELARSAGHEEVDDGLGLRSEMRRARRERVFGSGGGTGGGGRIRAGSQERGGGDFAEADTAVVEEMAAG
jgi:hypothetical protein